MKIILDSTTRLTDQEKIEKVFFIFEKWYLKDIRKVAGLKKDFKYLKCKKCKALMAAIILCFTFLDSLSGYYSRIKGNRARFKCFTAKFLPQYNSDSLWVDLRNPLIHGYSVAHKVQTYIFRGDGKGHMHAVPLFKNGKSIKIARSIEVSHFIRDISNAFLDFKKLAERDKKIQKIIIKKFSKEPLIGPL